MLGYEILRGGLVRDWKARGTWEDDGFGARGACNFADSSDSDPGADPVKDPRRTDRVEGGRRREALGPPPRGVADRCPHTRRTCRDLHTAWADRARSRTPRTLANSARTGANVTRPRPPPPPCPSTGGAGSLPSAPRGRGAPAPGASSGSHSRVFLGGHFMPRETYRMEPH